MPIEHVAIVGAGFSGTLQAINLLRHQGPRATLIERSGRAGEGLAYGAAHPSHVLNVRAGNMSAFPDDPGHFVRWLDARGVADAAAAFIPRVTYGEYLRELLETATRESKGRLRLLRGEVDNLEIVEGGVSFTVDKWPWFADAAVLAVGNLPPHDPPGLDADLLSPERYKRDPWDASVPEGLGGSDTVLVIGTGLTMVDVVLLLDARGFRGRIVALSRRGLLPRPHAAGSEWERIAERPDTVASQLLHQVRARGDAIGWRSAVDELRSFTQGMWGNATEAERARFLRHLRPWWDVHRHRLAPEVWARLSAIIARGQLEVRAGKTLSFEERAEGVQVAWRPRGKDAIETLAVQRIVNCTGPQGDLMRTTEPLLQRLAARGVIRPDAAHLGIEVDNQAQTIDAKGPPQSRALCARPDDARRLLGDRGGPRHPPADLEPRAPPLQRALGGRRGTVATKSDSEMMRGGNARAFRLRSAGSRRFGPACLRPRPPGRRPSRSSTEEREMKTWILAAAGLAGAVAIVPATAQEHDAAIRQRIIRASIASYPGSCACPYSTARNGSRCGGRSAWSRGGGYAPKCYPSDVTPAEVAAVRRRR
ncbi:MAG: FAD/NAD(P)-binding protein [Sphingomonas sp.]